MRDDNRIPEINWELRTPEEVVIEQNKLRAGKCIYTNCGADSAPPYKLCLEHILPLLDIMHHNVWMSDEAILIRAGFSEKEIEEYGKTIKYRFEL